MKTPVVALVNKQNSYEVNVSTVIGYIVLFHTIINIIILEMKDLKK